ncbi:hypothetical protein LTR35_017299 [Friedmanniomyces endolithicus]|uniref:Uncharacterized protein n=1 Tax=Friedmanniomyces endolithicus TaxID=329885 RepID=A0A4U0TUL2_9PEZI|nr:hypothetical protein LTS09_017902 [Friedmanniomyces endolithicus]KAK0264604.1 hypothetical protein LTR35_017299 [Friedmanniomyces endolithicus]KAK0270623.1 hypothetical protein LTS00_016905 [Friedmanniomyces endolithicus]KAK0301987.1 hypothetical protein LTR01_009040 [Friedmanniomyces endolithicus]KAK0822722.1 hypothetical protein LTR73_009089 [Friedmanniomyces endolithicus]
MTPHPSQPSPPPQLSDVVEAQFAAFTAELATLDNLVPHPSALNATVTISALPVSAEQIAAQAREELSGQKGKRDVEMEEEREEAGEVLWGELEEMEGVRGGCEG